MIQLSVYEDLVKFAGTFWVDSAGNYIHIHPFNDKDPNNELVEITTQKYIIKLSVKNLGYIQIKGFILEHAGNGFPRTGVGSLFTYGGYHWIIENNIIRDINYVGIEIGARTDESINEKEHVSNHKGYTIVRNNIISNCGTGGIQGLDVNYALVW